MAELKLHLATEHNVGLASAGRKSSGSSMTRNASDGQHTPTRGMQSPAVASPLQTSALFNGEPVFRDDQTSSVSPPPDYLDSGRASQISQNNVSTLEGLLERAQSLEDHLRRTHVSASLVDRCRENSQTAVQRLSAELLRCKQQYWTAVDSMQKAHDEVRSMRLSLARGEVEGVERELISQCSRLSDDLASIKASDRKKAGDLEAARGRCQTLELECAGLHQSSSELAQVADQNAEAVAILKADIGERDKNAKQLVTFLSLQAKRQAVARKELRSYIGSLEKQVDQLSAKGGSSGAGGGVGGGKPLSPLQGDVDFSLGKSFEVDAYLSVEVAAIFSKSSFEDADVSDSATSPAGSDSEEEKEKEKDIIGPRPQPLSLVHSTLLSTGQKVAAEARECTADDKAWLSVFQYLPTVDLFRIGGVCRQWLRLSRFPALWRSVSLSRSRLTAQVLARMAEWCTETVSIQLDGVVPRKAKQNEGIVEYVSSQKGICESGLAHLLSSCGQHLQRLSITDCNIAFTNKALWIAGCYCPNLLEVEYICEEFPASPEALWSLSCGCRRIKSLRVPPVHFTERAEDFNDHCLRSIALGWPDLTRLAIGGPSLSLVGLSYIASGCPRLEILELDRVPAFNTQVAKTLCQHGFRGLRILECFLTRVSADAIVTFVGACPRLESISLQLGISDYYSNKSDQNSIRGFQAAMKDLTDLAANPPYSRILQINSTYG